MTEFPRLAFSDMKWARRLVLDKPYLLDDPDCPWSADEKAWLKVAFPQPVAAVPTVAASLAELGDIASIDVELEATVTYRKLELIEKGVPKEDTTELLQVVKAKAGLLDRLVTIREKWHNAKEIAEFKKIVTGLLDNILTVDQRDDFRRALKKAGTVLD